MKYNPKMGDNTKQVRVDNWGIFFLQRLQMFFSKTDYCDMTLQFEGNVQLKVHRLVLNACTEYFQFLEQTCALEDNIIMMPSDLQADVIVPIVNFMYTGMLEFHLSIFDRLYKTAQIMNITILMKLLDAQKQPGINANKPLKKKHPDLSYGHNSPDEPRTRTPASIFGGKKPAAKLAHHPDLPATLPGRKLPIWKRKSIPTPGQPHSISQGCYPDPKWSSAVDPLSLPDNTPKPTRFEWPDDDLPPLNPMDTSFEEISYTSKPLLTQKEEHRASTSFDDLKHIPNANRVTPSPKKRSSPTLDMEEMKNYVKEQKIRSDLSQDDQDGIDQEVAVGEGSGSKRKATDQKTKGIIKRVRFDESENRGATTISIATDGKNAGDLDHEKIVTEILKKYPQLVKKNKNIKLKIMAKNKGGLDAVKVEHVQVKTPRLKTQASESNRAVPSKSAKPYDGEKNDNKAPWVCERCSTEEEPVEFVLYYLYRKHMTDVHNEKFDSKLCKYCGHRCNKHNLLMYHLYTKHCMKPPPAYSFPKCDQCPFIALSSNILNKHKMRHNKNEIRCVECKLTFSSQTTLTSHMQITGHTGKTNKNNYDCQYCTKRYQSGVNLFSHVRLQHRNEAIRDGIVSIDEADDVEDYDEEDSPKEEYILPEIITESEPTKKVNILSNVKVHDHRGHHSTHQQIALEPSSEAEALNNVATGIATSLGLVDIVVINDDQQLFLESNPQNFSNDQGEQSEFILPELTGRETFAQNQNEVITEGVITQQMLSSGDIGSTDELVMVLTDHDYGDNQEEINNDNSNIVVLYSHPVDDQQEQFITSQGNIMVNSQTGLIEIRNGTTITSTSAQAVEPPDSHIESIEMIQREIESHGELKQESGYEEGNKLAMTTGDKDEDGHPQTEKQEIIHEDDSAHRHQVECLNEGEQLEFASHEESIEPSEEPVCEAAVDTSVPEEQMEETVTNEEGEENEVAAEAEESKHDEETEESQRTEEVAESSNPDEETEESQRTEEVAESNNPEESQPEPMIEDKCESPVAEQCDAATESQPEIATETGPDPAGDAMVEDGEDAEKAPELEEQREEALAVEEFHNNEGEKFEEPDGSELSLPHQIIEDNKEPVEEIKDGSSHTVTEEGGNEEKPQDDNPKIDLEEQPPEEKNKEEMSGEQELSQSDTSTSQFNDENSQSSQESQQKEQEQEEVSAKISILDDWEDTDSQQSDQKEKAKAAGEAVHKLMDDWEEEDEDDSKKEATT